MARRQRQMCIRDRNKRNACGPGQTYIQISKFIPKNQLNIYLTYEDFKKFELK